jgi:hypothetical protein
MNPQGQCLVRAITGPIILITVGVLFTVERFCGISFGQTWPVLLIVIGILKLLGGRRPRLRDSYSQPYVPPYAPPYTPPGPADAYRQPDPPPPVPGERR